ncbi:MAG: hypothetical protein HS104_25945 [Polyangiaceae bacterium]|nr:hypothetical protein [Polyangiaceae bacterium]MCL4750623.1 hypothetical protein [Myxococcales bacterium]
MHRPTAVGTEDFLVLEQAPAERSVQYEVALSGKVRGLRLVAGSVQLLDAGGAPRLRMVPPYLVKRQRRYYERHRGRYHGRHGRGWSGGSGGRGGMWLPRGG